MKRKKKLPKYQLGNGSIDIKSPTTLWGWNQNANIDMLPPQNREGVFMINQQNTPITEDLQQQTQMDKSYSFGFNPVAYAGLTGINQFLSGLGSRKEESKYKQSLIDNGNSAIPFANNFSSGVKYGYQKGGRAPKVYTDRKQFEQAQRMYNDSLNLYNNYKKPPLGYIPISQSNSVAAKDFKQSYSRRKEDTKGFYYSPNGSSSGNEAIVYYGVPPKKPVQPVVYQPQGTQTQPYKKTISSIHQMTHPIQKMDRIPNQYPELGDGALNPYNRKKSGYSELLTDNNYKKLLKLPSHIDKYKNRDRDLYYVPYKSTPDVTHFNDPNRTGMYNNWGMTVSEDVGAGSDPNATKSTDYGIAELSRYNPNIEGQPVPFPQMQVPQQKGTPVYGPGNTIIGYSDNMNFKPAYQYTGAPNNQLNLQDKALLADPEALKKYVLSRDNYKFPTEEFQQGGFSDPGHEEIINNGYPASIPTNRYVTENPNDPTYGQLTTAWQQGYENNYNNIMKRIFDGKTSFIKANKNKYIDELRTKFSLSEDNGDDGVSKEELDVLEKHGYNWLDGFKDLPETEFNRMLQTQSEFKKNPFYTKYIDYKNTPFRHSLYESDDLQYKNSNDRYTGQVTPQLSIPIPMLKQTRQSQNMSGLSASPLSLNKSTSNIQGTPTSMNPGTASLDFTERSNSQMSSLNSTPSILESFKDRMKGLPTNMTSGNATLDLTDETPSPVRQSMESMTTGNYPFNKDNNVSFNPQAQSYPNIKNSMTAINPTNYRPSSQQANITGTPVIPNTKPININLSETEDPIVRDNKTMSSINPSPYPFTKSGTSQITGNMQEYPKQRMGMIAMSSAPYSSNNPANIKGVQTNMQIPTVQQPSYTTHPIEVYDKRGKFLRKEFIGNDKGVADHKYIGRHHYAPRGGNSYIDTSYQGGGTVNDYRLPLLDKKMMSFNPSQVNDPIVESTGTNKPILLSDSDIRYSEMLKNNRKNTKYKPSDATLKSKAVLAAASYIPNPISKAITAGALTGADLATAINYAADGQWGNAGIDFLQAGLNLVPNAKRIGTGMKGEDIMKTLNWIKNAKRASDVYTGIEAFQKGGVKPKIYTDRKQFEQAQRMYNDSSILYNSSKGMINDLKLVNKLPGAESTWLKYTNDWYDKNDKQTGPAFNRLKKANKTEPIGKEYNDPKFPGSYAVEYKKPVQPVILKPVPRAGNINIRSESLEGFKNSGEPIYTSDPNDKRLQAYNDSSALYKKTQDINNPKYYENGNPSWYTWKGTREEAEAFAIKNNIDYYYTGKFPGKIKPISTQYWGEGMNAPIYKKPVQPVVYQSHPIQKMRRINPQQLGLNSNINIQGQPIPFPEMNLPQQKGTPVYGPGNTVVGYSDNMNFKPAYQYTGAPNNSMNLQDKELLNNPEALKKYIQRKDNYKFPAQEFQKGGSFNYDFLLEDDEDENQYNKNEAENNDRVTEEDVQEEVAKQSRKLADMEFLFGSNKVRKDRDVNRFDDDYVAPDSSSDGTDWASKFKSVEDPNSKFDHGNGAYGSFGFRKTGHLAEAYKSPEFQEVREQFGDYNSFWNSFKQSGYGPLSKTVDSRYEDWLKRQTGNNISIAGKFNLTGSKSPSSNWMVGNNIPWQGYVNKLNKYKTGGTYSVNNEEIANLIQKGVKFKFV